MSNNAISDLTNAINAEIQVDQQAEVLIANLESQVSILFPNTSPNTTPVPNTTPSNTFPTPNTSSNTVPTP